MQNRNRLRDIRSKHVVTEGETWGGLNQELVMNTHTTVYKKQKSHFMIILAEQRKAMESIEDKLCPFTL